MITEKKYSINSLVQFITYTMIGTSNVLIDIIVFNLFWAITGHYAGKINYLFKIVSFAIYSTTGYLLNKNFTFKTKGKPSSYFQYITLLAFLSFLDAVMIANLTIHRPFGLDRRIWGNICVLLGAMATGIIGFAINKFYIFKHKRSS
ncbi:membrane protein [Clostridium polyendosporum]|uniref:Membrane protein n=1 Tax=Clostridium polyendosporum TaxID=69208 RepID=A0A919RW22_9CLOT|nr:GtrA family protein [Clostridium polyendosporum]GIM27530.1 membrane protein [Clostridium polyendosporum]